MALVYKFSAGADNLTHLMENRTIRFTPPLELNDPFECGLYTDELFRASGAGVNERFLSSLIVTPEDVQHFNSFAIRAIVQRTNNQQYGILSLTHVRDDILMWAHYAKHHTGFVLGFDSENEFFKPLSDDGRSRLVDVKYSGERLTTDVERGVLFKPELVSQELEKEIFNWFFLKSPHWSYERETRMVAMLNSPRLFPEGGLPGVTSFPASAVAEIVIGSRASAETVRRIYELHAVNFPHAELLVAWLDPHKFSVNIRSAPSLSFMDRFPLVWEAPILPPHPYDGN